MKLANSILFSVFINEGEDQQAIAEKLKSLVPLDLENEKIQINTQTAIGFNEKKIKILELQILKDRHINPTLELLNEKLGSAQKELLLRQKDSRLDANLNFFIRLDKPKLLNGEYWITDNGNCFHIKINIAAFPRNRDTTFSIIGQIFA